MNIYCGNCGKYGHIYKKCNQPIMSLGIICFKIIDEKIHYLLIKRKCSLNYVELIRGKYTLDKIEYIYKLFELLNDKYIQKFTILFSWCKIINSPRYIIQNEISIEKIRRLNKSNS
jgi:hypothetical protein